jgi:nucleotide-binding universal stress UspA family protein
MTFSNIVVGFDGSARAADAARQAVVLALHGDARVVLAHATGIPEEPHAAVELLGRAQRRLRGRRLDEDRRRLDELHAQLASRHVAVSQVLVEGFADTALAGIAHQQGADLIVVGTHGRTGLRRLLLGSVAENTVRRAETSVLVVRGEPIGGRYRQIVVGTDFSPFAVTALTRALELAAPDATIDVVHAWGAPTSGRGDHVDIDDASLVRQALAAMSEERGAELVASHANPSARLVFRSREGIPAETLCEAAALDGADLIVIGSHGYRGVRRFVLGSVAEAVVRHAPCSVLVAR